MKMIKIHNKNLKNLLILILKNKIQILIIKLFHILIPINLFYKQLYFKIKENNIMIIKLINTLMKYHFKINKNKKLITKIYIELFLYSSDIF